MTNVLVEYLRFLHRELQTQKMLLYSKLGDAALYGRNHVLVNVISLSMYVWASLYLAEVKSRVSFVWMHAPWMIFGICSQLFGIIAFVVDGISMRGSEPAGRQELTGVFRETEQALMWLQIDVGFSLIACSDWIMIHEAPTRMVVTIFVITALPLIAWASVHPRGAVGLTQLASIIHIMACLHANVIVLNFWGVLTSVLMFLYLFFISLPQEYAVFRYFPLEVVNVIYPAFMSWVVVRGFSDLSKLQNNLHHQD
ncbi:unnamed protein product [Allacma fusca]|uniref:Uncharacterized protein n=1 Tax=Allacma fusca TaxID=39272 RepID=A0A8J2PCK1_9HEXA|nr:unnamed protein product [Allacma fusca]